MVFFHAFITIGYLFDVELFQTLYKFFLPIQPCIAGTFILISGMSSRFSKSNVKRGLILLGVSLGITLVLYIVMPDEIILFGILHFLSIAILLFAFIKPLLDKIPIIVGILISLILFLLTYNIPADNPFFGIKNIFEIAIPPALTTNKWLFPLGFSYITTSDYFPIFPWLFLFLAGTFLGIWAKAGKYPQWMNKSHVPFLSWLGKHSLIIYIAHQPIIYGVTWLIFKIIGK